MISVYLRPDATQVVRAKVKKGILNVQESKTIEKSFLPEQLDRDLGVQLVPLRRV